jgi:hypothetical protein
MGAIARFFGFANPRRMTSLIRFRGPVSERIREREENAAADVARIRQDEKYFGRDAPAKEDEL